MKIINRGFLVVKPLQAYWDWANKQDEPEMSFAEGDDVEANVYLIEEDFFETEPVVEQYFKKIFKNELGAVNPDETSWPEKLTRELFDTWFEITVGSTVFDTQKQDLVAEKL